MEQHGKTILCWSQDVETDKLFLGLLSGDIQALATQFDVVLSGDENNWQLQLMPSGLLMKQIFNQIIIQGNVAVQRIGA